MAVVVNEFEVETQPVSQPADGARSNSSKPAPPPEAHEVEKLMCLQVERYERIRAH
jgi:hypothetical protein